MNIAKKQVVLAVLLVLLACFVGFLFWNNSRQSEAKVKVEHRDQVAPIMEDAARSAKEMNPLVSGGALTLVQQGLKDDIQTSPVEVETVESGKLTDPREAEDISIAAQEQESIIENYTTFTEAKNPDVNQQIKTSFTNMLAAAHDCESFVARKGTETNDVLGRITEDIVSDEETVNRIVHFARGEGPLQYAQKRVFTKEGGVRKELKNRSYVLQYFPDGKIKSFVTRGAPQQEVHFYPSGKIKQYDLVKDEKSIVAVAWTEGGAIKYEEYAPEYLQTVP